MTYTIENKTNFDLAKRLRRNRKSPAIRSLLQETHLHPQHFVAPLFVMDGINNQQAIHSMPGVYRLSIDLLLKEATALWKLGIKAIDLFPVIPAEKKDFYGSEALNEKNILVRAIIALKKELPDLCVMADIALDPFTDHGHDGIINEKGEVINDTTLEALGTMSVLVAQAGADMVAPSDMMDGRVRYIRSKLDESGLIDVNILAYAAKYASAFYGPFRDALSSGTKIGDKKGYQLNPANWREALLESSEDEYEAADILMVKPALAYLDIIAKLRDSTHLPIAGYHVSGEYAMVKAAAQNGWIDGDRAMHECLLSIKRAGADFILTYAAREMAEYMKKIT